MEQERRTIAVGKAPEGRPADTPRGTMGGGTSLTNELEGSDSGGGSGHERAPMPGTLTYSISEAANVLGVSDDLVYELVERKELPCLRLGRRRVIPRRAIDLILDQALAGFDPDVVRSTL
jgi:excisionase family DNA binding protein